jgi:hypothetical protein
MTAKTTQNATQIPYDSWKKMIDEQLGRIEGLQAEFVRFEKQGVAQANQAIDELAKLMKDSIDYTCQISAEWRKVAMDAAHKASDMIHNSLSN